MSGNFKEEKAVEMVKEAEETIATLRSQTRTLVKELTAEVRLIDIPANTTWIYQHNLQPDESGAKDNNSAVIAFFQYEVETLEKKLLTMILLNFLRNPFFDDLRTKQQLGYIVSA